MTINLLKRRMQDLVITIANEIKPLKWLPETIGALSNLTTNNKDSIVSSINDVNSKISNLSDSLSIKYTFSTSASWIINHTFNRHPKVSVYLDNGEEILADVIHSTYQINIVFAQPTSGYVILS